MSIELVGVEKAVPRRDRNWFEFSFLLSRSAPGRWRKIFEHQWSQRRHWVGSIVRTTQLSGQVVRMTCPEQERPVCESALRSIIEETNQQYLAQTAA